MKNRNYRFLLEGSSHSAGKALASGNHKKQKHLCSQCSKRSFVRYVDVRTGNYLPDKYGKCDHEGSCGYAVSPYKNGFADRIWKEEWENKTEQINVFTVVRPIKRTVTYMPRYILQATQKNYTGNQFIQNLASKVKYPFQPEDIKRVIELYALGTISKGYLKGGTTFPFIDKDGNIRVIQAKTFDANNHTLKTGNIHSLLEKHYGKDGPKWLSEYLKNQGFFTCLFGEHLLKRFPTNTIALVEAPKTAILGTLYHGFPSDPTKFLWLAVYNLSSLNIDRCLVLEGRNVVLFPDLSKTGNAYVKWKEKADYFNTAIPHSKFIVSDFLETRASSHEKEKGGDLADYFTMNDWRKFREGAKAPPVQRLNHPVVDAFIQKNPVFSQLLNTFDLAVAK
jgi:hypothetical protein